MEKVLDFWNVSLYTVATRKRRNRQQNLKKREKTNVKMKKKQIAMLFSLRLSLSFWWVSFQTPGTIADRETYQCGTYATIWSLLPPVIAIGLALVTKEVYTSLLAGIITGALLYANFNLELMINTMLFNEEGGMVYKLSDSGNVGILFFWLCWESWYLF